jgi:hypothetical protein
VERAADYAKAEKAPATRRAYQSDWAIAVAGVDTGQRQPVLEIRAGDRYGAGKQLQRGIDIVKREQGLLALRRARIKQRCLDIDLTTSAAT